VKTVNVVGLPAKPTAGLTFRILVPSLTLSTGAKVRPSTIACAATLSHKTIRGTAGGHCTYRLPATAGGQWLVVRVVATYKGASRTRSVAFKVRSR
jgi:hypothetical protein